MDKYHSMSRAARHPDGLAVVAVFLEATDNHYNHAELAKITTNLKLIPNKGDSVILKQPIRLENLLPTSNRSYWSYQGSLTTPPYYESVTWFVLKQPIKCNATQIDKFRQIQGSPCCNRTNTSAISESSIVVNGRDDSGQIHAINQISTSTSSESLSANDDSTYSTSLNIQSNHRATQPLHGRVVYNHDDPYTYSHGTSHLWVKIVPLLPPIMY